MLGKHFSSYFKIFYARIVAPFKNSVDLFSQSSRIFLSVSADFFCGILETGLSPSWFVKASAIWEECLNDRGEGSRVLN